MREELYRPLGQTLDPVGKPRRRSRARWLGAACALALVAGGSAYTAFTQPGFAPAPVSPTVVAERVAEAMDPPAAPQPNVLRMEEGGGFTITDEEGQRPLVDDANLMTGSIRVLEPGSLRQPAAFAHMPEQSLLESTDFGPLPVRGADGRRPLDVYAGNWSGTGGTRVAIVVGGIGVSQSGSQRAVEELPAAVTLAFAAEGNSLDRWMQAGRRNGHELLLQAPMEPFGYPNVSAGPHTLKVADAAAGRLDDLHWSLGRLTNYVGVMNYMGARLNADPAALQPFLGELSKRGLLYLDDGSSPRSGARDVAVANGTPFAAADLVIDAEREPQAIGRQLDVLERIARAKGTAIGTASAFDVSIDVIGRWAAEAAGRGIEIVPISALAFDPEARS
ncbi:divergent polysaccharide deacetylase family protein [Aureimonas sp. SK2]|uniref:divergent polysaccharide deacetylase family protein n=1 Tax=Aureimonas sp. SK2 TaxID=3015992 RepID=UPI00244475CC|nr:divergent polysaccharide deacetylase family protein [Aureimonas sp. SK2]